MATAVVESNCELGSWCQDHLFMLFYTSHKVRFTATLLSVGQECVSWPEQARAGQGSNRPLSVWSYRPVYRLPAD